MRPFAWLSRRPNVRAMTSFRPREAGPGLTLMRGATHEIRSPATQAWDRGQLLARVRSRIRTRHLSDRTEETYLRWIRRYLGFHGRKHPGAMGRVEVERFIRHLAEDHGLSAESQNQAASAVAFLYRELFGQEFGGRGGVTRAKEPSLLPRYAPPEDVDRVLRELGPPYRLAAMIMYGSGTRLSETLGVRIQDLDLPHRELVVRHGKGAKDRTTVIAEGAVAAIRAQVDAVAELHDRDLLKGSGWAELPGAMHRKDPGAGWELGWQYLFPSAHLSKDPKTERMGRRPLHNSAVQRALKAAVRRARITRPLSAHVLRHCFATEMVRSGCDIRVLQRLMGHNDIRTTMRYLHVPNRPGLNLQSPFDRLPSQREGRLARLAEEPSPQPNPLSPRDGKGLDAKGE